MLHVTCMLHVTTLYSFPWILAFFIFNSFKVISQNLFAFSLCLFPKTLQILTSLFYKSKVRKLSKSLYWFVICILAIADNLKINFLIQCFQISLNSSKVNFASFYIQKSNLSFLLL